MARNKKKPSPVYPYCRSGKMLHSVLFNRSIPDSRQTRILCDIILFDEQGNKITFNKVALTRAQLNMPKEMKYLM